MQIISLFYPPPFKTDFLEYSYFKKSNISDNNCFNTEKETCSLIEYNMLLKCLVSVKLYIRKFWNAG